MRTLHLKEKLNLHDDGDFTVSGYILFGISLFVMFTSTVSLIWKYWWIPSSFQHYYPFIDIAWCLPISIAFLALSIWVAVPADKRHIQQREARRLARKNKINRRHAESLIIDRDNAMSRLTETMRSVVDIYTPQSFDDNARYVEWALGVLSFGKSTNAKTGAVKKALAIESSSEAQDLNAEISDLTAIWKSSSMLGNVALATHRGWSYRDEFAKSINNIGKNLGIFEMVDAYYNGVPVYMVIGDDSANN